MNTIITNTYEELSEQAAKSIIETVQNNPRAVLGLATGSNIFDAVNTKDTTVESVKITQM